MDIETIRSALRKDFPILHHVYGMNKAAFWSFDVTGFTDLQRKRVFPQLASECHIGKGRIIQLYLEECGFDARVTIYPTFYGAPKGSLNRQDHIYFGPTVSNESLKAYLESVTEFMTAGVEYGTMGHATIEVINIRSFVEEKLKGVAAQKKDEEGRLSIADSSKEVWNHISRNMKGVIHNWMLKKGSIFVPSLYAAKPTREGSRLSLADQVTIGLLYGMFTFGVSYDAFEPIGRMRFSAFNPLEDVKIDQLIRSDKQNMWG